MRRLLVILAACGGAQTPATPTGNFAPLRDRVLADLYKINPASAVSLGLHEHDGEMPDMSRTAIDGYLAMMRADRKELEAFVPGTPLEQEERDTLIIAVRGKAFTLGDYDVRHRNPMEVAGDFNLDDYVLRDYAPLADRAAAVIKVCTNAGAHLEQSRKDMKLPIPKPWVETATGMFKGLAEFADKDVRNEMKDGPGELGPALDACKAAFTAHAAWLAEQLPHPTEDYALGKDKFLEMLEETQGIKLDLATLDKLAHEDLDRNTRAIEEAAHEIDKSKPVGDVVADVLRPRPTPDTVLATADKQATELRQFLIDHHIVTIPSSDVALVRETPSFARWNSASLSGAGPFEAKALPSFYYISPPDPTWTPEVQAAYIPPTISLFYTTVHEVYPGHFINALYLKRSPSKVEKSLWSYTRVKAGRTTPRR